MLIAMLRAGTRYDANRRQLLTPAVVENPA
jgi:hypothetical protein